MIMRHKYNIKHRTLPTLDLLTAEHAVHKHCQLSPIVNQVRARHLARLRNLGVETLSDTALFSFVSQCNCFDVAGMVRGDLDHYCCWII